MRNPKQDPQPCDIIRWTDHSGQVGVSIVTFRSARKVLWTTLYDLLVIESDLAYLKGWRSNYNIQHGEVLFTSPPENPS
jgi:hypothetical protein